MPVSNILIIIPVYNEAAALPAVINELKNYADMDLLIVDDASTDGSLEFLKSNNVRVLPLVIRLGAWGAIQTGIRYALKHNYQFVITMDGDGQHHSHEIPRLVNAMHDSPDADVVIGEYTERGSRLRQLAWLFFRTITGLGIEDITSGFRMYNKKAIELLAEKEATLLDYQDIGVLLMLKSMGLKIMETRVSMTPRLSGKSHIFSSWFIVAYYMLISTILSISKINRPGPGS